MAEEPDDDDRFYQRLDALRASTRPADRAVAAMWDDVTDRRGWRQEADQFDPEIKLQILETWSTILIEQFGDPPAAFVHPPATPEEPTDAMIAVGMPWLINWRHMRKGDQRNALANAYKDMAALTRR